MFRNVLALAVVLTIAIGSVASTAHASLILGDGIVVNGVAGPTGGGTYWGTHAPVGWQQNGQLHLFGGSTTYADQVFSNHNPVFVTSGTIAPGNLPAGATFGGWIQIDYSQFGFNWPEHSIFIGGIKAPGENSIITSVSLGLNSVGVVSTDGFGISWSNAGGNVGANPIVYIEWFQEPIPAPGALALLALTAAVSNRRRRGE